MKIKSGKQVYKILHAFGSIIVVNVLNETINRTIDLHRLKKHDHQDVLFDCHFRFLSNFLSISCQNNAISFDLIDS